MGYDAVLSMGRDPRMARSIKNYQATFSAAVGTEVITTTTIDADPQLAMYILVSLNINNTSGATNPLFEVFVGEAMISRYIIPQGQVGQAIYEVVPINRELWGTGNTLRLRVVSDDTGQGLNVTIKISLFTATI